MEIYPLILLPKEHYKKIECDVSDFYLIRHFDIDPDVQVINELGHLSDEYICKSPEHIKDLSTSLFGHFLPSHTKIKLTKKGASEYEECCPNFQGVPLKFNDDYVNDELRRYWLISLSVLKSMNIDIIHDGKKIQANSYIVHTPMKWNFWHYSIRWLVDGQELLTNVKYTNSGQRAISQRIGAKARSIIAQNAFFVVDSYPILRNECFSN
ncbi:MAG: hypothetical protein ACRYFL_14240 [Janthinobacterium lividum]